MTVSLPCRHHTRLTSPQRRVSAFYRLHRLLTCRAGISTNDLCARGGNWDPLCAQHGAWGPHHCTFCHRRPHTGRPGALEPLPQGLCPPGHPCRLPLEWWQCEPHTWPICQYLISPFLWYIIRQDTCTVKPSVFPCRCAPFWQHRIRMSAWPLPTPSCRSAFASLPHDTMRPARSLPCCIDMVCQAVFNLRKAYPLSSMLSLAAVWPVHSGPLGHHPVPRAQREGASGVLDLFCCAHCGGDFADSQQVR